MSLEQNLRNLTTRIATAHKALSGRIGVLANLKTTARGSLVDAVNELSDRPTGTGGAPINDGAASTSSTYSSSKTTTLIADARSGLKAELLGGATSDIDTLKEIADKLAGSDLDDDAALAVLTSAVGKRVRFDDAQTLTAGEKAQALSNIGAISAAAIGDPEADLVAVFEAGIA